MTRSGRFLPRKTPVRRLHRSRRAPVNRPSLLTPRQTAPAYCASDTRLNIRCIGQKRTAGAVFA